MANIPVTLKRYNVSTWDELHPLTTIEQVEGLSTALTNKMSTSHDAYGVTTTLIGNWNTGYSHSTSPHAPSDAQKNSDILKSEIEAVLTGAITTHTHSYAPTNILDSLTEAQIEAALTNVAFANAGVSLSGKDIANWSGDLVWDGDLVYHEGNNPTKSAVGLANVENYGIATQTEAEEGTLDNEYMTPLKTKQAIEKQSEWLFEAQVTNDNTDGTTLAITPGTFDWDNYDYKVVVTTEVNTHSALSPYIKFDGQSTDGKYSWLYRRSYIDTSSNTVLQNDLGDARATQIETGVYGDSSATGNDSTKITLEFTISQSHIANGSYHFYLVEGKGSAVYGSDDTGYTAAYATNAFSHFTGVFNYDTGITSIVLYNLFGTGSYDDFADLRLYKRKR